MGGGSWGDPSKASSAFSPLGCRAPHFYRCVLFEPTLSTASLSSPSPQGSTWEAQGGAIPSTTPSHSKDKARSVDIRSKFQSVHNFNPFKISICSKFQSVQSFNPFKVELKRLDFIQLPLSPPLVGSPNSHAQRRVKQRFRKNVDSSRLFVLKPPFSPAGWVRVEDGGLQPDLALADQELRARQGRPPDLMILPGGRSARATRAGQYLL